MPSRRYIAFYPHKPPRVLVSTYITPCIMYITHKFFIETKTFATKVKVLDAIALSVHIPPQCHTRKDCNSSTGTPNVSPPSHATL